MEKRIAFRKVNDVDMDSAKELFRVRDPEVEPLQITVTV